jgi:hypothetical protein
MWQVSIYPLSVGQIVPEAGERLRPSPGKTLLSKHAGALMPCLPGLRLRMTSTGSSSTRTRQPAPWPPDRVPAASTHVLGARAARSGDFLIVATWAGLAGRLRGRVVTMVIVTSYVWVGPFVDKPGRH